MKNIILIVLMSLMAIAPVFSDKVKLSATIDYENEAIVLRNFGGKSIMLYLPGNHVDVSKYYKNGNLDFSLFTRNRTKKSIGQWTLILMRSPSRDGNSFVSSGAINISNYEEFIKFKGMRTVTLHISELTGHKDHNGLVIVEPREVKIPLEVKKKKAEQAAAPDS